VLRRCLEKRPEDRFQSTRDLGFALDAMSGARAAVGLGRSSRPPGALYGIAALAVVGLGALTLLSGSASRVPRVTRSTEITSDAVTKYLLVTDGSRVYFNESRSGEAIVAQVAARGGGVARIATSILNPRVADVSADGAELLVLDTREPPSTSGLWIVPVVGGPARRVGGIPALDAAWSHDGHRIAYTTGSSGSELFVASGDGSDPRRIWTAPETARWPTWSPDGRRLRLTLLGGKIGVALWEIGADGQDP